VSVGRTKLEPVAIVVLSVIMSLASIQMIRQSVERIVAYAQYDIESATRRNGSMVLCVAIDEMEDYVPSGTDSRPVFELDSIIICVVTVGQYKTIVTTTFGLEVSVYGSATVRMVLEAFCLRAVRRCICARVITY